MNIQFKLLSETAISPYKHHWDDAGIDIFSDQEIDIGPNEQALLGTGVAFAIPSGYCGIIKDRSSMATKRHLQTLAGVIDAQYRGEVKIALKNISSEHNQHIMRGEKIAQMLILPVPKINLIKISSEENLSMTERGECGFGSSGK